MPIVQIVTNLPKSKITNEFVKKTSQLSAELTNRPEAVSFLSVKMSYLSAKTSFLNPEI
jgi:hypothetical protein